MQPTLLFAAATFNLAETTRMIEIARACEPAFDVQFCGYGGQFAGLIDAAGYPLHRLQPELTPEKIDYLWRVDRLEEYGQPFTVAELAQRVASERALYHQLKPAAVVMGSVLSVPISARAAGIPLLNVVPLPLSRAYLQAGLPALPNVTERLPAPLSALVNRLFNAVFLYVPLLTTNFNKVARRQGLRPFPSLMAVWEGDYNLVTDIPALTGLPQLPPHWQYVGQIVAHLDSPLPPEVRALAQDRKRPLIYFAMGSSGNREVVARVLQSFDGLPVDVIAPIRALLSDGDLFVPDNVLVTDWLPALEVNRLADLAVIHGGQGTVQTACMAGRPFVGVGMQPEQEINIDFVVRWGSALRVRRGDVTPERMRAAILQLLTDPQARERAAELAAEYAGWDGARRTADFLRAHFASSTPPAGYHPQQNLDDGRLKLRPWLVGGAAAAAALLGTLLWRRARRR